MAGNAKPSLLHPASLMAITCCDVFEGEYWHVGLFGPASWRQMPYTEVLRNLRDGCTKLRLLDIKIGQKSGAQPAKARVTGCYDFTDTEVSGCGVGLRAGSVARTLW